MSFTFLINGAALGNDGLCVGLCKQEVEDYEGPTEYIATEAVSRFNTRTTRNGLHYTGLMRWTRRGRKDRSVK